MLVLLVVCDLFFAIHCNGISAGVQVEMAKAAGARDFVRPVAVRFASGPVAGAFMRRLGQNYDPDRTLLRINSDCAERASRGRGAARFR
jgi:hypothetical protein